MLGLPFDDIEKLDTMAQQFTDSRAHSNTVLGCVGAVGGIAVKLRNFTSPFCPKKLLLSKRIPQYSFPGSCCHKVYISFSLFDRFRFEA
jgi:hypothetical protein